MPEKKDSTKESVIHFSEKNKLSQRSTGLIKRGLDLSEMLDEESATTERIRLLKMLLDPTSSEAHILALAIKLYPDDPEMQFELGYVYFSTHEYEAAIQSFKEAIRKTPSEPKYHRWLGHAFLELGDTNKAIEAYKRVIGLGERDADIYRSMGYAFYKIGRYELAIESYKAGLELNADDPELHAGLGQVYSKLRQYQKAVASFVEAIRINPDKAVFHYGLGICYYSMGKKRTLRKHASKQFGLSPTSPLRIIC